jgi:hypothetical protein
LLIIGTFSPSFYVFDGFVPEDVPLPTAPLGAMMPGSLLSSSISRLPSSSSSIRTYFGDTLVVVGGKYYLLEDEPFR